MRGLRLARALGGACLIVCLAAVPAVSLADLPPQLVGKLHDRDGDRRAEAMEDLARLGTPEAVEAVVKLGLGDKDAWVRENAFRALPSFQSPESVATLCKLGLLGENVNAAIFVAEALAEFSDDVSLRCLQEVLAHRDAGVRKQAAQSLETRAAAGAKDALDKAYKRERDPKVKANLLYAMSACDEAGRAELLTAALQDTNWPVRVAALDLLSHNDADAALTRARAVLTARQADTQHREPWQEGVTALQVIRTLEQPGSHADALRSVMDQLLVLLGKETGRLKREVHLTLASLTGETRRSDDPKLWEAWWRMQHDTFDFGQAALREPEEGTTTAVVSFFGEKLYSDRLAFALDMSGSMMDPAVTSGEQAAGLTWLDVARRELLVTLKVFPVGSSYNVILFATQVLRFQDTLTPVNARSRKAGMDWVTGNVTQAKVGRGDLWGALELAMNDPAVDTVLLFNDGGASEGKYINKDRIIRHLALENRTARIAIDSMHFGVIPDGDNSAQRRRRFSEELATTTGGRFIKK